KSYHSNRVPSEEAKITRRMLGGWCCVTLAGAFDPSVTLSVTLSIVASISLLGCGLCGRGRARSAGAQLSRHRLAVGIEHHDLPATPLLGFGQLPQLGQHRLAV